jgi:DNA-binding NtrC family response regulator
LKTGESNWLVKWTATNVKENSAMKNCHEESIVVVDDDQGILDSFDAMLGDDYTLTMINSGSKAIQLLHQQSPRLLFLDIKMPGMNGLEILKWIQDQEMDTKVVIVTALPQDQYEEMAQQYGVYRYLRKPLDVDEVEDITRSILH